MIDAALPASGAAAFQTESGSGVGIFDDATIQRLTNGGSERLNRQVWSEWSPWSACSATCGGGLRDRSRECLADDLFLCGDEDSEEEEVCNTQACPRT